MENPGALVVCGALVHAHVNTRHAPRTQTNGGGLFLFPPALECITAVVADSNKSPCAMTKVSTPTAAHMRPRQLQPQPHGPPGLC